MHTPSLRHAALHIYICIAVISIFTSCTQPPTVSERLDAHTIDSTTAIRYAKGFTITHTHGHTIITILNPQQATDTLLRYTLCPTAGCTESHIGITLPQPLTRIAITSATQAAPIAALSAVDRIIGATIPQRIYTAAVRQRYEDHHIAHIGTDYELDQETIIALHPSALLSTLYSATQTADTHFAATDIPIIYIQEWQEQHPLGRAEWLKLYGALLGKTVEAHSLFAHIEAAYLAASTPSDSTRQPITVISGEPYDGTWHYPTTHSYIAQLIAAAGGTLASPAIGPNASPSIQVPIETAIKQFADADVWIGTHFDSLDELLSAMPYAADFKAVRTHQVYNVNHRTTPQGANDYWESGIIRPDLILSDIKRALCPTSQSCETENSFYQRLR